ncbi:penicillin-binding transpeptidase domain-containing protein [Thermodesulfobacteriota bacterium]
MERSHWRKFQSRLKRTAATKSFIRAVFKSSLVFFLLIIIIYWIDGEIGDATNYNEWGKVAASPENKADPIQKDHILLNKREVRSLLSGKNLINLQNKGFDHTFESQNLRVETSLDVSLQRFIQKKLNRSISPYIGIVVMDPLKGKILSMAGFDKDDPSNNPCINSKFPAASIFKIVTAAAAIEKYNFDLTAEFAYNGRKHTLYKYQLREQTNKYTNWISFKDSFAQSVNPVFGKLGANLLGAPILEEYAAAFGFNRNIEFEAPVSPSVVNFSDEPYQWAEIASGFNRKTTLSPLHGAMMISAILNRGKMMEPTIVNYITDENGKTIYRSHIKTINQVISPMASEIMNSLMEATIKSGTARKAFKGYQKNRILSRLNIGGKTGSINSKSSDTRYDWFVGFAAEKSGAQKIVISAFVAHEKYIGTRAGDYARLAIKHYFQDYFSKNRAKMDSKNQS